ncbi:unnamed protein product [Moneuplotes crassus]|uniref:Uncharacterized protein n=1 Tax=Euplotes crassus TaxID=5936 RepID=A0AAD1UFK6_EUPCR|nr:unnamed protein product [Moneuplotes crassus]
MGQFLVGNLLQINELFKATPRNKTLSLSLSFRSLIQIDTDLKIKFQVYSRILLKQIPHVTLNLCFEGFFFTNKYLMKVIMQSKKCKKLLFKRCNFAVYGFKFTSDFKSEVDNIKFEDINSNLSKPSYEMSKMARNILQEICKTSLKDTVKNIFFSCRIPFDKSILMKEIDVGQREINLYPVFIPFCLECTL